MFENLTSNFTNIFSSLGGKKHLSSENIEQVLREIRISLLEADVALSVVKNFIAEVKKKIEGQTISGKLSAEQTIVKIVNDELVNILGPEAVPLNLKSAPPVPILMTGLQGSGKTTTSAKLASFLKEREKKKVMLVSLDVYRPAAIEQLQILAAQLAVEFFSSKPQDKPIEIAHAALDVAKKKYIDVIIFDSAGRLHVDEEMMAELVGLQQAIVPTETIFVVDSMTGQDAVNTAKVFHEAVPLTGIILTKTDGDARGGVALSVKEITGQPIKFLGIGEKIDALEPFYPERIASRILGMGDMLSLIEEVERKVDKKANEKLAKKVATGRGFDLEDFKQQLLQMNKMGGISGLMSKLPGIGQLSQKISNQVNDKSMARTVAIINSMTMQERRFPKLVAGSRKKRIALGAGTQIPEVNRLLKQYEQMQKMMKKFSKPKDLKQMMRGLGNLANLKDMFKG